MIITRTDILHNDGMEVDLIQRRRTTERNATGKIHFQEQSYGFRRSLLKMVPCPSSRLQLILCSMKVVSPARGRGEGLHI